MPGTWSRGLRRPENSPPLPHAHSEPAGRVTSRGWHVSLRRPEGTSLRCRASAMLNCQPSCSRGLASAEPTPQALPEGQGHRGGLCRCPKEGRAAEAVRVARSGGSRRQTGFSFHRGAGREGVRGRSPKQWPQRPSRPGIVLRQPSGCQGGQWREQGCQDAKTQDMRCGTKATSCQGLR